MKILIFLSTLLLGSIAVRADIRLPALVGDHMVLQRDKPVNLWGSADPGERIIVNFSGKTFDTSAGLDGHWTLKLPSFKAGGPYTMTIKGKNTITLQDIVFGDIWICSGQSNMEFPLNGSDGAKAEMSQSDLPDIRLFSVNKRIALSPADNTAGSWQRCNAETAANFPAIGYYFGKALSNDLNVPIGLINASWGGTVIESWISSEGLKGESTFGDTAQTVSRFDSAAYNNIQRQKHAMWVAKFNAQDTGYSGNRYQWASTNLDDSGWQAMGLPIIWEFKGLNVDGVVWFRKTIDLNQEDLKNNFTLNLGVIQNADRAFINGTEIGQTGDKWGFNRAYSVPSGLLKAGQNQITIRVENYGGDGGFSSSPESMSLQSGGRSIQLSGTWKYKVGHRLSKYDRPQKEINPNTLPTLMYNNMISPLVKLSIKGVIWYQGESNWYRGYQYRELFPRMIQDWRSQFKQGDFPFLYVQLANHHNKQTEPGDSYWAEVREAQDMTLRVKNTGMVTAIDVGNAGNIHPTNKKEVGKRLALVAKEMVYSLPVESYGPRYKSHKVKDDHILVTFDHIAKGLQTRDGGMISGFSIAGIDGKFHWANAMFINKRIIKVQSKAVSRPYTLRYAWEDNPADANLINSTGLPAFPFRTDKLKGISAANKTDSK